MQFPTVAYTLLAKALNYLNAIVATLIDNLVAVMGTSSANLCLRRGKRTSFACRRSSFPSQASYTVHVLYWSAKGKNIGLPHLYYKNPRDPLSAADTESSALPSLKCRLNLRRYITIYCKILYVLYCVYLGRYFPLKFAICMLRY